MDLDLKRMDALLVQNMLYTCIINVISVNLRINPKSISISAYQSLCCQAPNYSIIYQLFLLTFRYDEEDRRKQWRDSDSKITKRSFYIPIVPNSIAVSMEIVGDKIKNGAKKICILISIPGGNVLPWIICI